MKLNKFMFNETILKIYYRANNDAHPDGRILIETDKGLYLIGIGGYEYSQNTDFIGYNIYEGNNLSGLQILEAWTDGLSTYIRLSNDTVMEFGISEGGSYELILNNSKWYNEFKKELINKDPQDKIQELTSSKRRYVENDK